MLYAIIAEDVPNSLDLRKSVRPEHIQRLETLKDQGRLTLAGPHPTENALSNTAAQAQFTGSLIVAEFDSLDAAKAWADADPYKKAGVYAQVTVKPFKLVLP